MNDTQINIRVPKYLKKHLQVAADTQNRTLASFVRIVLTEWLTPERKETK